MRFLRFVGTLPTYGVHFFFHLREMLPLCSNMVLHHGKEYMNKKSHMRNLEKLMLAEVASFRVSGQGGFRSYESSGSQTASSVPVNVVSRAHKNGWLE